MTSHQSITLAASLALVAGLLICTGRLRAQTRSEPTFRSGVSLVLVDVVVRDNKTGKLVTDLTRDDFDIDDEGRPQTIASFALAQLPDTRTARTVATGEPASGAAMKPEAGHSTRSVTNQGPEGRLIIFLLDDLDLPFDDTGRVRGLLHEYLNVDATDRDEVAIWAVSDSEPRQGFTDDRTRLGQIIDRLQGNLVDAAPKETRRENGPPPIGFGFARAMASIQAIADQMERIGGRRKVLVLVSDGWIVRALKTPAFQETVRLAAAANLAIYPIDPTGIPNFGDVVSRMSDVGGAASNLTSGTPDAIAVRAIAKETGGVSGNSNNFDHELARIEEDAGTYYMLGFTPSTIDRRGDHFRTSARSRQAPWSDHPGEKRVLAGIGATSDRADDRLDARVNGDRPRGPRSAAHRASRIPGERRWARPSCHHHHREASE